MIWFNPEGEGGFDLGTPDWSGSATKVGNDEEVSDIIIGAPYAKPPKAKTQPIPESPPEPLPEPEPPPPPPPDPRIENNVKMMVTAINELARVRQETMERDLAFCIDLAFGIAEKLVCGQLAVHPEQTIEIIKESIGLFEEDDKPVVRIHPELLEILKEHELLEPLTENDGIQLKPDSAVSNMGCVVTANKKRVDGQVLSRLEKLKTLFSLEQGGEE